MISSPLGPVPLSQIARVQADCRTATSIEHDGGQRRVSVTFNVGTGSLQDVVQQAQTLISRSVALPPGVFFEFTGAAAAERQTRSELLMYSGLSLALIVMILFMSFHWRANSWLVLANLPFSLIGSVFAIAVWKAGIGISLGTVVEEFGDGLWRERSQRQILQLAHYFEHLVENRRRSPWNI